MTAERLPIHPDYATYLSGADQEALDQMQRTATAAPLPSKSSTWAQARELFYDSNPVDGYWDNLSDYSRKRWFDKARAEQTTRARVAAATARATDTIFAVGTAVEELKGVLDTFDTPEGTMSAQDVGYAAGIKAAIEKISWALATNIRNGHGLQILFTDAPATAEVDEPCTGCGGSGYATLLGMTRHHDDGDDTCSACWGTGIEHAGAH